MAKSQRSFVETFIDEEDALQWCVNIVLQMYDSESLLSAEVKRMKGGGYRAGVIFDDEQYELFGSTEDA